MSAFIVLHVHAHALALLGGPLVADGAVHQREQRMVTPDADVGSGLDRRPALPHQDRPRSHQVPVATLDAQALALAVPPVASAAHSLLVRHPNSSPPRYP